MENIGVLFDLDGVLIDTETIYTQFWSDIEKEYPTGIDNFAYKIKGNNLALILNTYFPDTDLQKKLINIIDDLERNIKYVVFPGVLNLLEELKANNIPCAIVTSSDKTKVAQLNAQLPTFNDYFKAVITGDMVSKSKPDPECFLRGAKLIGCDIKDCYVFEDSPAGITAGLESGATVIAVASTLRREDINPKAHKIVDALASFTLADMLS